MRPAQTTLENYQAQQRMQGSVQTASYEPVIDPQTAAAGSIVTAGATTQNKQMSVTSIALPNNFQIPEGTAVQPISSPGGQAARLRQAQQPVSTAQQTQAPNQQPATPMQSGMQMAQPPVMNSAAMMQQMPAAHLQMQQASAISQRPVVMAPVNTAGIYYPQNQGFAAPISTPQYVGQQAIMPPAAQPMMAPVNGAMAAPAVPMMPQQPMAAVPMQQAAAMPAAQTAPQQGYQQVPAANGVRTAVSYGPATIPWR
jgi:hypothetical protein